MAPKPGQSRVDTHDGDEYKQGGIIHDSFPPMGNTQPAHLGSQSGTPDKEQSDYENAISDDFRELKQDSNGKLYQSK